MSVISTELVVDTEDVVLLSVSSTSRRSLYESFFLRTKRSLSSSVSVNFQVIGFSTSSSADTAGTTLSTYFTDSSSSGFVSEFNTAASTSLSGASVTSSSTSDSTLSTLLAGYDHNCALSSDGVDKLYWNVDVENDYVEALQIVQGGRYIEVELGEFRSCR